MCSNNYQVVLDENGKFQSVNEMQKNNSSYSLNDETLRKVFN